VRRLGYLLVAAGVAATLYICFFLAVGDPVTAHYGNEKQRELRRELADSERARANSHARAHPRRIADGDPLGVIRIPRIGLEAVFVQGTRSADLAEGPGHYPTTALPGSRRVVAIAGHRTTYGAWFRHIDELGRGDAISLDYGGRRYTYVVTGHEVVAPTNWNVISDRGYPTLVLSTCHPVYSASHRYIVFARLVRGRQLKT
jgi:sortase A